MTVLQEHVVVPRPANEAFDYVSDFTTTTEWDSTALEARKLTDGPIAVGTQFEVICALPIGSITLVYEVEELVANKKIVLAGQGRFFNIRDTITFTPEKSGTRIDYRAEFDFRPWLRPLASRSQAGLEKMGRESVAGLGEALRDDFPLQESSFSVACADRLVIPGVSRFTRLGYKLASKNFNPMTASVRDKHVVITGASAGLGLIVAGELARRGARLTLVMRDPDKAQATVAGLVAETGNDNISCELADLSLLGEVDSLVKRLKKLGEPVDVLINNAGALFNPRAETPEGIEQSHALLLLSPCRLTEGLKPLLLAAPAARVINVVSGGMYSQRLEVDKLTSPEGDDYSGSVAYARQKRALMVMTEEWAERWEDEGIVVNAMHPGWADTPGVQQSLPEFRSLTRPVLRTPLEGADTIVWLAIATEAGSVNGKLFLDRQVHSTHLLSKTREPEEERERLFEFLQAQGSAVAC